MKDEPLVARGRGLPYTLHPTPYTLRSRSGYTLIELLVSTLILGFLSLGGVTLYIVGFHQQRVAQHYSQVQTDLRTGLARANRTLRHAFEVVDANTVYSGIVVTQFPNNAVRFSNAAQLCIRAPQPTATGGYVEIRFYLSNGTLLCERADAIGSPTTLLNSVQALTFNYFQTSGGQRTAVDNTPAFGVTNTPDMATEVQITITGQSSDQAAITATAVTTVNLRNKIAAAGL